MRLRKLLMASAAIVSLSATMSSAQAAQPYASLFGGASFLQSQTMAGKDHTRTTAEYYTATSSQSLETSFKTGFVLGGNAGVEWGNGLRTEVELAFRQHTSKRRAHLKTHFHSQYLTYVSTEEGGYTTIATSDHTRNEDVSAKLKLRAWSLMANAWYDFDLGLPITPYVGGGIGLAQVKVSGDLDGNRLFEKNDSVFAWQVGVGASVPITDIDQAVCRLSLLRGGRCASQAGARLQRRQRECGFQQPLADGRHPVQFLA